jgi:hypothetical protein
MLRLINSLIKGFRQIRAKHKLKGQQLLSGRGVGFRTKALDVKEEAYPLKDYVQLCIFTRLRINGKIVYRRVHTLLNRDSMIHSGDRVHIRYNPFHLNTVLLCGLSKN